MVDADKWKMMIQRKEKTKFISNFDDWKTYKCWCWFCMPTLPYTSLQYKWVCVFAPCCESNTDVNVRYAANVCFHLTDFRPFSSFLLHSPVMDFDFESVASIFPRPSASLHQPFGNNSSHYTKYRIGRMRQAAFLVVVHSVVCFLVAKLRYVNYSKNSWRERKHSMVSLFLFFCWISRWDFAFDGAWTQKEREREREGGKNIFFQIWLIWDKHWL